MWTQRDDLLKLIWGVLEERSFNCLVNGPSVRTTCQEDVTISNFLMNWIKISKYTYYTFDVQYLIKVTSGFGACNPSWQCVSPKLEMDHTLTAVRWMWRVLISWKGRQSYMQAVVDDRCCLNQTWIFTLSHEHHWNFFFLQTDVHTCQRMFNERERDKLSNINTKNMWFWRGLCECVV